jgi:hypothetical protein
MSAGAGRAKPRKRQQSSEAFDFLRMVLHNLDRMRESADKLEQSAEFNDHLFAAYDLLNGLCNSIKMFSKISLPHLLGPNRPLRPSEDLV